ncbi:arylsulfatase B [Thalassoroseus pseudoceratinae]|uniref:arylsulfatase B n=1 Tax=Thalassoroseus pseudoceratinae TaxID=2713176 RepID=UPI0014216559|nr:arylsulfatase [Thalassoroseus pseudoceratinae]
MNCCRLLPLYFVLLNGVALLASEPPNIVHIIVDDLGWNDVGFHNRKISTPVIDELAKESVVLERFYVTPICSPTRAGVLTGRYPFRFGIWGGVVSPDKRHGLPPAEQTTPELLQQGGYQNRGLFGKWHLGLSSTRFHPLKHGFTHFVGHYNGAIDYFSRHRHGELDWHTNYESRMEKGYLTDLIGRAAVEFIDNQSKSSPFYMFVAFNAPHSPLQAKRADLNDYGFVPTADLAPNTVRRLARRENAPSYGMRGRGNTIRQTFSAMVSALDRNVGDILEALNRKEFAQNTIVIFHSDNGADPKHGGDNQPLRGNKFTTWEGGVRVVAMIRWPRKIAGGRTVKTVASYVDLLPTLLAAAGQELPTNLDGINLLPMLTDDRSVAERVILLGDDTAVSNRWKLKAGQFYDLLNDPTEISPVTDPPLAVSRLLRTELARFTDFVGPKTETSLPLPKQWPPREWKLPEEPRSKN